MTGAYGIDFGTTNSVLARATQSGIEVLKLDDQLPGTWAHQGFDRVLPSVIGFEGSTPIFGWAAKKQTTNRLEAVKRLFATDDNVDIGGHVLRVEEAAAIFFRHVQERAAATGAAERLDQAVVTIPANSRGKARYRTKLSAGLAGIQVLALINEPTAAAMAHARTIGENQRVLVFDWGGGTLDVTVLQAIDGTFIEQASKGVQRLGGIDVDAAFLASLTGRVNYDRWTEAERAAFRLELELAKIVLSDKTTYQVPLPDGGYLGVTRAHLQEAVKPLIDRTREPVDVCLRESPGRIDHLVMVGGSSKMPAVQEFIAELVGVPPSIDVDPMTAIAEGAAIAAGILTEVITDIDFYVGTEHALGTIVHNSGSPPEGSFSTLIRRNTKLPARATDSYTPALDSQRAVNIEVIEGDPSLPIGHEDNVILKEWSIDLLEPRPVSEASFTITYEYDVDGILQVRVVDEKTGTVMMDEELAFGAGQDRRRLPEMRQRVDDLMDGGPGHPGPRGTPSLRGLSAASAATVKTAREKVIPYVADVDRARLEQLVKDLQGADATNESSRRDALEHELRNHAYLL